MLKDSSLFYSQTDFEATQSYEEITDFIANIKHYNKQIIKQLKIQQEEKEDLKRIIEELGSQLQEKQEQLEQNGHIIQECEIQVFNNNIFFKKKLESQRDYFTRMLEQQQVEFVMLRMLDKIEILDKQSEMMKSGKKTQYSTANTLLQTSFQQKPNQDSLFKDSHTIESMAQTEADQSMCERRNSIGKVRLKGFLKQNENIDPLLSVKKQKEQIKREIQQWQEDFVRRCGREPTIQDKQLISKKYEQYTQLKNQLDDCHNNQKNASVQVQIITIKKFQEIQMQLQLKQAENRTLQQQLDDMQGKVRVICRIRPTNEDQQEIHVEQHTIYMNQRQYQFDTVFEQQSSQQDVYKEIKMLNQIVQGFNVCIFSYGQTGSGKTHTMFGTNQDPGIVPRLVEDLFKYIKDKSNYLEFLISFNAIEIYKDNLIDLLSSDTKQLDIKEDINGMYVQNVTNIKIQSLGEIQQAVDFCQKRRKVSSTEMNDQSSRSHMVIQIMVDQYNKISQRKLQSKICLIDLAGSERCKKSKIKQSQLDEAKTINKSLSALSDVIMALSQKEKFVPFRNSKLTYLMKDCLGGNSKTIMIVNISPDIYNIDETLSSLQYAQRAKNIQNQVCKNTESNEISKLRDAYKKLQEEYETLKKLK